MMMGSFSSQEVQIHGMNLTSPAGLQPFIWEMAGLAPITLDLCVAEFALPRTNICSLPTTIFQGRWLLNFRESK